MTIFPLYLLRLGNEWKVVFPDDRADIGHSEFWEHVVAQVVARHFKIPLHKLVNLPYCQRRARIVGNKVYYGERPDPKLLNLIRRAVGNKQATFCHDEHEIRLKQDVLAFRRLVRGGRLE